MEPPAGCDLPLTATLWPLTGTGSPGQAIPCAEEVRFSPPRGEAWKLLTWDEAPVCELPCDRWVLPSRADPYLARPLFLRGMRHTLDVPVASLPRAPEVSIDYTRQAETPPRDAILLTAGSIGMLALFPVFVWLAKRPDTTPAQGGIDAGSNRLLWVTLAFVTGGGSITMAAFGLSDLFHVHAKPRLRVKSRRPEASRPTLRLGIGTAGGTF